MEQITAEKIFLIDGNAYIHRAFHALPPLTTKKGENVNAIFGFLRMLLKLLKKENPQYCAVCFDHPSPTFRHKIFPEYKITRKEIKPELKSQIPIAKTISQLLGFKRIEVEGYEADDIIAAIVTKFSNHCSEIIIISGDKDVLQLVGDNVKVLNEQKNIIFDKDEIFKQYGVNPQQLIDIYALCGDKVDNVPGVSGIGIKTATKLIQEFGSIENLLGNYEKLNPKFQNLVLENREELKLSKKLIALNNEFPIDMTLSELKIQPLDYEKMKNFLINYEFFSLLNDEYFNKFRELNQFTAEIICTLQKLSDIINKIENNGLCCIDIETTGLNFRNCEIVSITLKSNEKIFFIPFKEKLSVGLPGNIILTQIKKILEDKEIKKIGHNLKFETNIFRANKINLQGIYFDTMIAAYCLEPGRSNYNLKDLVLKNFGIKMTRIEELIGKGKEQVTLDLLYQQTGNIQQIKEYASGDVYHTYQLYLKFQEELTQKNLTKLFFEVEIPFIEVIADMEYNGIKIDEDYFINLKQEFTENLNKLTKKIWELSGYQFNINSPIQLRELLYERLKLPIHKKTKTGASTDEETLLALRKSHPIIPLLIEYRENQKLLSTYIDTIIEMKDPITKRIYSSFNPAGTATGRLSSSEPNLQNIPIKTQLGKKIRRGFLPEDNYTFILADYSQIDLRSLAHLSGDKNLIESFHNNQDIHITTACEIFGLSSQQITPEHRRIAKTINFGIIYGMSAYGLSKQLDITQEEAQEYIDRYFSKFPQIKTWHRKILNQAQTKGYVETILGRRRYIPEINSNDTKIKLFGERIAMNTPVQGTSSDIIKIAMIKLYRLLKHYDSKMLVQVHDDLLFEVRIEQVQEVAKIIKDTMETAVELSVPLKVELKKGNNWNDMIEFKI